MRGNGWFKRLTEWTLGRSAAEGEEEVLWPRNGDQEGGLVLAETDTYGGVSDLADEDICEPSWARERDRGRRSEGDEGDNGDASIGHSRSDGSSDDWGRVLSGPVADKAS